MDKLALLQGMLDTGVVAIVRLSSSESLIRVAEAIAAGGVRYIEFTMTTPGALKTLEEVSTRFGEDVVFGAGTVLDAESARAAILAGAKFIVAPTLDPEVIEICSRYSVVSMPGALTPTEVLKAWDLGADVVKVFPASAVGGPSYIKALLAPLPQLKLAPVGGVNLDNVSEYIRMGAVCVGVGSALVNNKLVASGDWAALTERAKGFIEGVKAGRQK
ncbi:MAG: bifunctional 4-hydroxy-2-oxoglutarate aldolase/2-dehydro-3-deoxy-phosphogluconate aldolase [Anaerolineae bacterium]|nr:bifunctional 4-hydroxy-2-oxoglutarate aldolase/2-dehydro-3-deoxy-phosphogluconate aldolase [Anaerolineae bacterium]